MTTACNTMAVRGSLPEREMVRPLWHELWLARNATFGWPFDPEWDEPEPESYWDVMLAAM